MQFSRSSHFDEARRNVSGMGSADGMFVDDGFGMSMDMGQEAAADAACSARECADRMAQSVAMLQHLPQIAAALGGAVPDQLQGLSALTKLLAFVEVVRTPQERASVAAEVQAVFDALVRGGALPRVLQFLPLMDQPQLQVRVRLTRLVQARDERPVQWEASRIVQFFAPGPRIAGTAPDTYTHPNSDFCKKVCRIGRRAGCSC
jgi:hypothetical protein